MNTSTASTVLYLSHGGGPLPLMGDASHAELVDNLKLLAGRITRPSAVLVISAHWEESVPTVTAGANPSLLYDYYGFPAPAYEITYPAPGDPALARRISDSLNQHGIDAALDEQRGFDHGVFVPLKIMYPQADIPCVELSLTRSLHAERHIDIGEALSALNVDGLLTIGSGFSFHNMQAFFTASDSPEARQGNEAFEAWLIDTCANPGLDETERKRRLANWEEAPSARYCHPREEHLLPLHVCYGMAGRACSEYFELHIINKKASVYLWQ